MKRRGRPEIANDELLLFAMELMQRVRGENPWAAAGRLLTALGIPANRRDSDQRRLHRKHRTHPYEIDHKILLEFERDPEYFEDSIASCINYVMNKNRAELNPMRTLAVPAKPLAKRENGGPPDMQPRVYIFKELKPAGVPYTRKHVTTLEYRGEFPMHFNVGANRVAWVAGEVDAWVEERIRARRVVPLKDNGTASPPSEGTRLEAAAQPFKRGRGRPKGRRNKLDHSAGRPSKPVSAMHTAVPAPLAAA